MTSVDAEPSGSPLGDRRDPGGFLVPFGLDIDPELLTLALTHRSWAFEHDAPHNERLEFLGDAILGQAVTVKLYRDHPDFSEDELAKHRAALVSTLALAEVARGLGLGASLRLGKGESASGGADKDSILADTVEAVIGAVYLSAGQAEANRFVLELIEPLIADPDRFTRSIDPKTTLQKAAARHGLPHPVYETTGSRPRPRSPLHRARRPRARRRRQRGDVDGRGHEHEQEGRGARGRSRCRRPPRVPQALRRCPPSPGAPQGRPPVLAPRKWAVGASSTRS